MISPGAARCWSRAATLTASPVAKPESTSSKSTSPDSIPLRTSKPSSRTCSWMANAARSARSASSSCAWGRPMAAAVIEGAAAAGADVVDIGLVGTEMVYFAVGELGLDGGVAVTASHNPKEYTGMKIVRRGALPVGGESGLLDVRDRAVRPSNLV